MKVAGWVARAAIAVASLFVLFGLAPVIASEWQGLGGCPDLGPLPACYLVAAAYAAMAIAALAAPRRLTWVFLLGWLPVFALAATGSALELSGRLTCPASSSGTPMCYYSLALAAALLPTFLFARTFSSPAAS